MKNPAHRFFTFWFSFFLLLLLGCQQKQQDGYKVIGVKDGDTIEILIDQKPVTVRLYGVDAPEKKIGRASCRERV